MVSGVTHARLTPFGIEAGIDLAKGLNAEDKAELRRLYELDGLIVMRGLELNLEEQLDLCDIFGPSLRGPGGNFIVSNVHEDGILGSGELLFHSDIPYVPAPYEGGALYAMEVSDGVSATRYASGVRAYARLPQKLRARIDGLSSLQVRQHARDRRNRLSDALPGDNCAVQPVVGRRRETGQPYLFAGEWQTACIIGMSDAESDALLEELFSYFYAADNIYDHGWKTGDIVIWDNLALEHARKEVAGGSRTLRRVNMGKLDYWDQYPTDRPNYESLYSVKQRSAA